MPWLPVADDNAPHILVIDDDSRIRTLLSRFLGEHGFRVTAAANAEDARRRLVGLAFDMLIVDVMMPGESGLDLTRSLRETMAVPILMVVLSTTLPARMTRVANLVVASLYVPVTAFNVTGESWLIFYGLGVVLELMVLAFILRSAWTWPRSASSVTTASKQETVRAR